LEEITYYLRPINDKQLCDNLGTELSEYVLYKVQRYYKNI
jgi:hypothetical protein